MQIEGYVAPGFEAVRQTFEHDQRTLAEKNAQLCIYVGDEKVVDLWASAEDGDGFSADSLVNVFSSGKSLEAIAMAYLVSQGRLDYNATIAGYWPEFARHGKDALTVADLMRHEAGMAAFDVSLTPEQLLTENIKQNQVGRVIEDHGLKFREGDDNQREYHAITRGWIANELFRRVDVAGRTIGEFVREEISERLDADVVVGVAQEDLPRISPIQPIPMGRHIAQTFKPRFLGRKVKDNVFQLGGKLLPLVPRMRQSTTAKAPPMIHGMDGIHGFNDPAVAMGESPSANAHCSARGLAKVAAMMATGGAWAGHEVLSSTGWTALHDDPIPRNMGFDSIFTQGGVALFQTPEAHASRLSLATNQGREGFYGWMGLGGSIFQWHPERKIGFAYVPTSLHVLDLVNERGKAYQQATLKSVG